MPLTAAAHVLCATCLVLSAGLSQECMHSFAVCMCMCLCLTSYTKPSFRRLYFAPKYHEYIAYIMCIACLCLSAFFVLLALCYLALLPYMCSLLI